MPTDRFLGALGLCRRAGKLSMGADAVADALKKNRAKLVIITSDASDAHRRNALRYGADIKTLYPDMTSAQIAPAVGKRVCVMTADDENLAKLIMDSFPEE